MSQSRAMPGDAAARAAACRDRIEEELIRGYIRLALTPDQASGMRTITLAQFGALEVRLTELTSRDEATPMPPFWVEIYSHACGSVVDSCGCFEFDEDELNRAVELVLEARQCQPALN
ncbi:MULTISPECIES: hypothetical protein [Microvirga]|uniref:hypothetical protein n=1 Tax=Microvirga TaxID=186650 RepID=UPI001CFF717B|nr:hypothetical protein [Microvirga lenta]MCB5176964.1 hypothetical protein [Microvirga lenta]